MLQALSPNATYASNAKPSSSIPKFKYGNSLTRGLHLQICSDLMLKLWAQQMLQHNCCICRQNQVARSIHECCDIDALMHLLRFFCKLKAMTPVGMWDTYYGSSWMKFAPPNVWYLPAQSPPRELQIPRSFEFQWCCFVVCTYLNL